MNSKILSASERKSIRRAFHIAIKLLEITLEKLNFTLIKKERQRVKDPREEQLDKIWKDETPQKVKKVLFSNFYGLKIMFEINKEKSGFSNVNQELKQDFYRFVDSTRIEKSEKATNWADLKSILFTFHEVLEGRGDEWAKQLADESKKEVASWSKEKYEYEANRGFSAINENLETIERENESLEGKNWDEVAFENKFKGDEKRGKETLLQIISPDSKQEVWEPKEPLTSSQPQSTVETDQKPTNYLPWIIGGLALAGVLIGIIWLIWHYSKEKYVN